MLTERMMIAANGITKVRGVTVEAIQPYGDVWRGCVVINETAYEVRADTPRAKTWWAFNIIDRWRVTLLYSGTDVVAATFTCDSRAEADATASYQSSLGFTVAVERACP